MTVKWEKCVWALLLVTRTFCIAGSDVEDEEKFKQAVEAARAETEGSVPLVKTLERLGLFYQEHHRYAEASRSVEEAISVREQSSGLDDPELPSRLTLLGYLRRETGDFVQAERAHRRAISVFERREGPNGPEGSLGRLALAITLEGSGRYPEAETTYKQAVQLIQKHHGTRSDLVAVANNHLGLLYIKLGRIREADPVIRRAARLADRIQPLDGPLQVTSLDSLAMLAFEEGKYTEAERSWQRALKTAESVGSDFLPGVLTHLGEMYVYLHELDHAMPLLKRSLSLRKAMLGPSHPDVGIALADLAYAYTKQGEYVKAGPMFETADALLGPLAGSDALPYAAVLHYRATYFGVQGTWDEAEKCLARAIKIRQQILGDHPLVASTRLNHAIALKKMGRKVEAKKEIEMARRSMAEYSVASGPTGTVDIRALVHQP